MAEKIVINSDKSLSEFLIFIAKLYLQFRYLRISIIAGLDRSIDQNSMFFELYTHIADWMHGGNVEAARAECKLHYGLPILRRDDEALSELCARSIDLLNHEDQLKFIATMSVTSEMSKEQGREYITTVMDIYSEQGLMWPDYLTKQKPKRAINKSHREQLAA
jgi:hypothetical protein